MITIIEPSSYDDVTRAPAMEAAVEIEGATVSALTIKHNNVHFFRWRTLQTTLEERIVAAQCMAAQPKPRRYALVAK